MRSLLVFIIGLFLIAAFFRVDFFFYILYVFFGVYFLSTLWLERGLKRVTLERDYTKRAFLGERPTITLRLRNGSFLPLPWLRLHESLAVQLKSPNFYRCVLSLLPREQVKLTYEVDCRKRGFYPLGPLQVSAGDLFGMHTRDRLVGTAEYLTVYPRIVTLRKLTLPAQTPFGSIATKQHIYEDPSRMVGVRAYQSGDSLRNIHWKSTAALGTLQVKRFEPAISVEALILLNLNRTEYSTARVDLASELAITIAASIANFLVEKRQTVGLGCNGFDPWSVLNPGAAQPPATPDGNGDNGKHEGQATVASNQGKDTENGEDDHDSEEEDAQPPPLAAPVVLPPRKGREHLLQMMDLLARIQAAETTPFVELTRQANLHLTWGGTAIVVTSHADAEMMESLVLMKRSGFHVVLVVVDPREPFALVKQRAEQVGIRAYEMWQESDLNVWR